MCSNKKCSGNICHNCVSEIITFKGTKYDDQVLSYQCPYCKSDSNKLKKHFTKLNDKEITSLITKKTTEILDKQEDIKYNLKCEIWELTDELQRLSDINSVLARDNVNFKNKNKQLENSEANKRIKELENEIIKNKLENHKLKIENKRLENIYKINQLAIITSENSIKKLELENEKKKFHCVCCNKTMNEHSKYNHFKTKKHLRNQRLNTQ